MGVIVCGTNSPIQIVLRKHRDGLLQWTLMAKHIRTPCVPLQQIGYTSRGLTLFLITSEHMCVCGKYAYISQLCTSSSHSMAQPAQVFGLLTLHLVFGGAFLFRRTGNLRANKKTQSQRAKTFCFIHSSKTFYSPIAPPRGVSRVIEKFTWVLWCNHRAFRRLLGRTLLGACHYNQFLTWLLV